MSTSITVTLTPNKKTKDNRYFVLDFEDEPDAEDAFSYLLDAFRTMAKEKRSYSTFTVINTEDWPDEL